MAIRNGKLFRFGQRQGFDLYGEGLMLYEITKLTEIDYQERLIQEILPKFKPGLRGIHHMTSNGSVIAFDQVRLNPAWAAAVQAPSASHSVVPYECAPCLRPLGSMQDRHPAWGL
jgi:hypothetical protein